MPRLVILRQTFVLCGHNPDLWATRLFATRVAARPPSGGFTYGLKRAEILSAQVNGVTYEQAQRMIQAAMADSQSKNYLSAFVVLDGGDLSGLR